MRLSMKIFSSCSQPRFSSVEKNSGEEPMTVANICMSMQRRRLPPLYTIGAGRPPMCSNCAEYREGVERREPVRGARDSQGRNPRYFRQPISRASALKTLIGGLVGGIGLAEVAASAGNVSADTRYVVLIVLDGARPEYFSTPNIPHVRKLIDQGTQYTHAFSGILESETPAAHVTINTSAPPRITGIPSFWWGTSDKKRVSLFSPAKIRAGDMEEMIRHAGVPTIAHMVHERASGAKVVALSGSKYYAADAIGGPEADVTMYFQANNKGQFVPTFIPGHPPPSGLLNAPELVSVANHRPLGVENHLAMTLAGNTFVKMRQQVTLINLPESDWPLGHVKGSVLDPSGVRTLMHGFDRDLAALQEIYRKAGVLDQTMFVLMADHGMMPLRHKLPEGIFTSAVAKAGTTIVAQAYTSAAYLWLDDGSKAAYAGQMIARSGGNDIQSVYARKKT